MNCQHVLLTEPNHTLLLLLHELLLRLLTEPNHAVVVAAWTANTYCWMYCCFNYKENDLVLRNVYHCRCLSCSLKCVWIQKIYILLKWKHGSLGPGHDGKLPRRLDRRRFWLFCLSSGRFCHFGKFVFVSLKGIRSFCVLLLLLVSQPCSDTFPFAKQLCAIGFP